jgi:hypothetical protein
MRIELDDLSRPEIHALLQEHLLNMHALSPAESVHALDLDELRAPDVTFWSAWDGDTLLGCAALSSSIRRTARSTVPVSRPAGRSASTSRTRTAPS